ncbi:MAG: flavoprotein [Planctomycetaceae bacterium]|jgi:phosphopantothenoylcysteine decarboxylase/phosphopantothenate--cysteine ligase|nr:flavoprotein [Planctomycetaceae bacterium]MDP7277548.1 phosphopantothenoylcysteine decarboxylase [Planctomycetaceae bacterium]
MRILITAGPTREYLDDVRYLSNASSGRMGYAVAEAAAVAGHEVFLVSGPVALEPPQDCELLMVETTAEMCRICQAEFDRCDGVIAVAAVCDYKPRRRHEGKLTKTGEPISIEMIETDDVLAKLGQRKGDRFVVGFALEADNPREGALQKLRTKHCDAVVLNGPAAIGSDENSIELIDGSGAVVGAWDGPKNQLATHLIEWIEQRWSIATR